MIYTFYSAHTSDRYPHSFQTDNLKIYNIKIYRETETIDFDIPICFIPWINSTNEKQTVEHINKTNATVAMGHLEIKGFEMHHGFPSETGMEKSTFNKFLNLSKQH